MEVLARSGGRGCGDLSRTASGAAVVTIPDRLLGMILTEKKIRRDEFETGTGWKITPQGACKGEVCVPLPSSTPLGRDPLVDVAELAEAMGLPLVYEEGHRVWALGPESIGARALLEAEAADFELPGLDGELFRLSSLRGQKVLVYAWAPY